jgi:chromate transporter
MSRPENQHGAATASTSPGDPAAELAYPTLREAVFTWLRVALLSFGGPAGQIAVMHRILVEEKRWLGDNRFLHALNFCMLLPGPEAQQLATYVGWLMHRTVGGLIAGLLFILPGALAVGVLSAVYAAYGDVPLVAGIFFGLKAAVLAIVIQALQRIASRALASASMRWLAVAAFVAIFAFAVPFPLIVLAAALFGYISQRVGWTSAGQGGHSSNDKNQVPEAQTVLGWHGDNQVLMSTGQWALLCLVFAVLWLTPTAVLIAWLGFDHVYTEIATFFSKMAVVTFGGAYAVLAYVAQAGVYQFGWLAPGEMLDGLGMAETTPGPLIIVTQFVGHLAAYREPGGLSPWQAGILGAMLTTWVTFVPCFMWIFLGAPYIERLRGNVALSAALAAVTAAVVGVVLNLAVWFAMHVLFEQVGTLSWHYLNMPWPDWSSLRLDAALLVGAALLATQRFGIGPAVLLPAAAIAGLMLH